jgi:acyl carrier protein
MSKMNQKEINERVNNVVLQTLNVESDEITESAHLINDLGAESIDLLDMTFRLEREFGIKIPRDELFPETVFRENPEYIKDGKITDEGVKRLREALPYANDFENVEEKRTVDSVKELFTVGLIYNYIDWKLKL